MPINKKYFPSETAFAAILFVVFAIIASTIAGLSIKQTAIAVIATGAMFLIARGTASAIVKYSEWRNKP